MFRRIVRSLSMYCSLVLILSSSFHYLTLIQKDLLNAIRLSKRCPFTVTIVKILQQL
jgi:hypothetical protein